MALTKEQIEKFVSIVEEGVKNGYSLKHCFKQASNELHISVLSLTTYWYSDDSFKEAREKIKKLKDTNGWTEELDLEFIKLMKKYIDEGYTIEKSLQEIARTFNKTFSQCQCRWYHYITKHYDVSFIKRRKMTINLVKRSNPITWTDENDNKLLGLMTYYLNNGFSTYKALVQSSRQMGLTFKQCENRWYSKLKIQYEENKNSGQTIEINQFENNESIQLNLDNDLNFDLTSSDIETFIGKISNLIQQNKELQEYKQKYDEIVNNMLEVQQENAKLKREKEELSQTLQTLEEKNKILKKKVLKLERKLEQTENDHKTLLRLINKARELSLNDEVEMKPAPVKFKMDRNGNLERIE